MVNYLIFDEHVENNKVDWYKNIENQVEKETDHIDLNQEKEQKLTIS